MNSGIYIHIPFCKQACSYCDFHFSTSLKTLDGVIDAILREIKWQEKFSHQNNIQSVYFGGGTPSIIPTSFIGKILEALDAKFGLQSMVECTLEANPDDMNSQALNEWKNMGINRFSIGVQSFFDADLKYMNRVHNSMESQDCIKRAQDVGFDNLSIDLIYGTPGLSDENWLQNLYKAKELQIPHLSTYALTVEERTPLANYIQKGISASPEEESYEHHFKLLQQFLSENGYEHYEISNSALKGKRALHNSAYWAGNPYYGFGPAAHGFDGSFHRYSNIAHNVKYAQAPNPTELREIETLSPEDSINEYILTSLRLLEGVQKENTSKRFGENIWNELLQKSKTIHTEWFLLTENSISINPEYRLLADGISAKLFY